MQNDKLHYIRIKYQYIELAVTSRNYVGKETKISILSD